GCSPLVDRWITTHRVDLSAKAESLCIRRIETESRPVLLIGGRDARGLSYALLEVARAVELAPPDTDPLAAVREASETPFLRQRSMTIHPFNADLESKWYYDERFWRGYFAMLARHRYNNFTLTFSDQTNYLNPIYAYLLEVPGFPKVRVQGLTPRDRERNLAMLRRIAELARERGLDFTLGMWMQAPVPRYSGKVLVENYPEGPQAANYCGQGLALVLQACPAITGVQLRMNEEAGVPAEEQTEFYRPLFRAVRECGRPVRIDLRYKGLQPATTQAAVEMGLDATVSTKFWGEHLGLPYHPTVADRHYRESRYSYGAMLSYPRQYRVVYRLWSVGSHRLLLWGDPEYAARFARSCRLGDGEGFEVFAPLSNKGYGNEPGAWRIFANPADEAGEWEYERYWFFHLVFGRLGYNPEANPEIWRRELRQRFGEAAPDVETAYRHASGIIPLLTATRMPGASEWSWWPEMDTGGGLAEYMHTQPSDTAQFYAIRSWRRTPGWRWEEWDATIPGYVEEAVEGQLRAKTTPIEVGRKLSSLAEKTEQRIDAAKAKVRDPRTAEFRSTERDLRVLAQLARYHAGKTLAATHLAFFELTGEAGRLVEALGHTRAAARAWRGIVQLTDNIYHDNLVFGIAADSPRSRFGHHHTGHWTDRLAEVERDVAHLEDFVRKHEGAEQKFRTFPGETPPAPVPRIEHTPLQTAEPGADLLVAARVSSRAPLRQVALHYRPLDQTADWKQMPMQRDAEDRWKATVPGKEIQPRWDFTYYFEIQVQDGSGRLWPPWETTAPYVVVKVNRPAR
ncbi:MAG: hypothetical protein M3463_14875, partial [Verrucomicrobiota bacterium]|nr:hypothetical protein [Verrucomicrobiota bacterium]